LGAVPAEKYMLGFHSNAIIQRLFISAQGFLQYSEKFPETHVFSNL